MKLHELSSFEQWFAGSKVVDKNGNPLRMYHSTNKDFNVFHPASHFGTAKAARNRYREIGNRENGRTIPVFLCIKNPFRVWLQESSDEANLLNSILRVPQRYTRMNPTFDSKKFDIDLARKEGCHAALSKLGYDGLVYENTWDDDGDDSWVIFRPDQVRFALTLSESYDEETPELQENSIINEKVTDHDLYHFVSLYNLKKILETDSLGKNTSAYRQHVLSLTRDVNHAFAASSIALFVLDAQKLKQKYSLSQTRGDGNFETDYDRESEERPNRIIRPLSSYLNEIVLNHLFFNKQKNLLREVVAYCKKFDIKISYGNFGEDGSWFRKRRSSITASAGKEKIRESKSVKLENGRRIIENPSRSELLSMIASHKMLRGVLLDNVPYVWNGNSLIHWTVINDLGKMKMEKTGKFPDRYVSFRIVQEAKQIFDSKFWDNATPIDCNGYYVAFATPMPNTHDFVKDIKSSNYLTSLFTSNVVQP